MVVEIVIDAIYFGVHGFLYGVNGVVLENIDYVQSPFVIKSKGRRPRKKKAKTKKARRSSVSLSKKERETSR